MKIKVHTVDFFKKTQSTDNCIAGTYDLIDNWRPGLDAVYSMRTPRNVDVFVFFVSSFGDVSAVIIVSKIVVGPVT